MEKINSNQNVIFTGLEREIEKKMLHWNGSDVQSFINEFSNDDYEEMACWSQNHAFGSVESELFSEAELSSNAKTQIVGKFISDCLMMVTQGQIDCDKYEQNDLVTHFYNLWMAVNKER